MSRKRAKAENARSQKTRFGIDTGGTFTDLVELADGRLRVRKIASTPDAPERAVLEGVRTSTNAGEAGDGELVHGSTVGLNALLTQRGARLALVTNAGFEDIIEIGRQERPELYAVHVAPRPTLVPRRLRFGIDERRLADGTLERRASKTELARLRERIARAKVDALVVCLLHSWRHPEDEARVAQSFAKLGIPIVLSSQLLRRHREFERFSTACIDAFVRPVVARYLEALAEGAAPLEVSVLRNEGGSMPWEDATQAPVRAILSGPAGGAAGARYWARRAGFERAVGFDMGGTSADVVLCGGATEVEDEASLGPFSLALPSLPLATVGTGGGSIAWQDEGGALRVGPQSAGADPGPACYGKGDEATVSDAHLYLGRLPRSGLLGGDFELHADRSRDTLARLAKRIGLSTRKCAEGILDLADLTMARPLRAFTLGRGVDPRDVCLVAYGGAGGLHAVRLARLVGFERVLVPPMQGALSAFGMLLERRVFEREDALHLELHRGGCRELEARARAHARESARLAPRKASELHSFAALRYRGNQAEFWVPATRDARADFEREFEQRFGFVQDLEVECLRIRSRLILDPPRTEEVDAAIAAT